MKSIIAESTVLRFVVVNVQHTSVATYWQNNVLIDYILQYFYN